MLVTGLHAPGNEKRVEVYCYPEGEAVEFDVPHTLYSWNLSIEQAEKLELRIDESEYLTGTTEVVRVGEGSSRKRNGRFVVIYQGDRKDWRHMPKQGRMSCKRSDGKGEKRDSGMDRLRERFGLPFAVVDPDLNFVRRLSIDELMEMPRECYDIEVACYDVEVYSHIDDLRVTDSSLEGFVGRSSDRRELITEAIGKFREGGQFVYNIGYKMDDKLVLYTLLPLEDFEFDFLGESYQVEVRRFDSQGDLIRSFSEDKMERNAFLSAGHNFMMYDMVKLRECGDFTVGIGHTPAIKAHCGFYKRVSARSRFSFDTASDSQQWNIGSLDNKLFSVFKFFFGSELSTAEIGEVQKDLSYEEQTTLWLEAMLGNVDSANELGRYCMKDVVVNDILAGRLQRHMYDMCLLFRREPDVICTSSRKSLPVHEWDRKYLEEMRVMKFQDSIRKLKEFDHEKESALKLKWRRGLFEGEVVYPTLILSALRPIVERSDEASRVLEASMDVEGFVKLRYLLGLQSWLKVPFFDMLHLDESNSDDRFRFRDNYGVSLPECKQRWLDVCERYKEFGGDSINWSNYFTILEHSGKLVRDGLGVVVSSGRVMSADRGRFAWHDNGRVMSQGISMSGNKGDMCRFERDLVRGVINESLCGSVDEALRMYQERISALPSVPREDLLIVKKMQREFFEYSSLAARREFIWLAILNCASKGEEFGYGFSVDGTVRDSVFMESKVDFGAYRLRVEKKMKGVKMVLDVEDASKRQVTLF